MTLPQQPGATVHLCVCSLCTDTTVGGEEGIGGGDKFLHLIQEALQSSSAQPVVELQPTRCLMGCSEGCMVSVAGAGKMQYLLGRFPADRDKAVMLAKFVEMYANSITGIVPNHEWPGDLALHFIGRIPPLEPNPDGDWSGQGCDL